ncbi:alpha/beta hydrolase [Bacillus weihaiensis]|uniref:Serine aminopeptidase S33 domain-containing protein n=1 Tax=Bacillus weihaiensis TaxID=1547283 RepID=A0A1L3MVQ1_9BACI|nr:alpha/beta hydrolase [Bacillus weihaiensis]APH06408.1 hypothetical protein A9C19_17650 [Bacillus weihaiensis]
MNTWIEEVFSVHNGITLKGTLAIPNKDQQKFPAIIMINGSGGSDRDGNMKKPKIESNLYKEIAHFVTDLGFISLRYDKRSVGESEGDPTKGGMHDLVSDVSCMVRFLKKHPLVDENQIILLGHSEGCILATKVSETEQLGGLILLGGAAANIKESQYYQNLQILEEIKHLKGIKGLLLRLVLNEEKLKKQFTKFEKKLYTNDKDMMRISMQKIPAKWFREHYAYTTEKILQALNKMEAPILAITGEKDVQAHCENLTRIDQLGKSNAKTVIIPNMDHMLKEFTGDKSVLSIKKQYKSAEKYPIHPQLKEELETWLHAHYLQ